MLSVNVSRKLSIVGSGELVQVKVSPVIVAQLRTMTLKVQLLLLPQGSQAVQVTGVTPTLNRLGLGRSKLRIVPGHTPLPRLTLLKETMAGRPGVGGTLTMMS